MSLKVTGHNMVLDMVCGTNLVTAVERNGKLIIDSQTHLI